VVVTVGTVRVVQMTAHQVVNVLTVRYGVVPALPAVDVALLVRAARVRRRASGGIRLPGGENVLVDVPLVEMMQVSLVEVVFVPLVLDRLVTAGGAVGVLVSLVRLVLSHVNPFPHRRAVRPPPSVA
jgi:hypothetical protein